MAGGSGDKLQGIQALRGLAVGMVLAQHLSLTATIFSGLPSQFTMPFYTGVDLFFVISGYVVTLSLFRSGHARPIRFLTRRAFRLWPAMLTFVLFSSAVYGLVALLPHSAWGDAQFLGARSFLLDAFGTMTGSLINIRPSGVLYYFGAMWSLSVEFQFYFSLAALTALLKSLWRTAFAVLAVLSICIVYRLGQLLSPSSFQIEFIDYLTIWRFDLLLSGCFLAYCQIRGFTLKI